MKPTVPFNHIFLPIIISFSKNYFAFRRMYPTNSGQISSSYISRKQPGIIPNLVESWMMQRVSKIQQLNYFKLKMVVPGDTIITVGDIIEFTIPYGTLFDYVHKTYYGLSKI